MTVSLEEFMAAGLICVVAFVFFLILGLFEHAYQIHVKERAANADQKRATEKEKANLVEQGESRGKTAATQLEAAKEQVDAARRESAARREADQARIRQLEQETSRLQGLLADPKKLERIADLRDYIQTGSAFKQWNVEANDSPLYRALCDRLPNWKIQVQRFLESEMPTELESCQCPYELPDVLDRACVTAFLGWQVKALEAILARLQC